MTSVANSANSASGKIRGPRPMTGPRRAAQGADPGACDGTGAGSGRSAMMWRRSPNVFALSAAEIRSSSSSEESRPSAK